MSYKGSNLIFFELLLLTTFVSKTMLHRCFCIVFGIFYLNFRQKSKKICQFFAIFSRCVSTSYEKFEKIIAQNT